jgi:hypothetical protein
VANVPRLDYLGSSCPRLLLEPQRTNIGLFSENFDNAVWTKVSGTTVTANQAISPDGYQNADLVTFSLANTEVRQTFTGLTATTSTASIYLKAATGQEGNTVEFGYANANKVVYTLTNEWVRVSVTQTNAFNNNIYLGNYSGQTATGILVWGFQLESSGAAYATSYIPTLGAAVTRGVEGISLKDITSFGIGNSYTLFFELNLNSLDSNKVIYETRNSSGTTSFTIRNFTVGFRAYNNIDAAYPLPTVYGSNNKYVLRVDGTSYSVFYASSGTPTKESASITTARNFGYFTFDGGTTNWLLDQHLIFPTALSDAQCLELVS